MAIDLGTSTIRIATADRVIVDEPAVAACRPSGAVFAVGGDARLLVGRNPVGIDVISPIVAGTPSDINTAELLLRELLRRGGIGALRAIHTAVVALPACAVGLEKRSVIQCVERVLPRAEVIPIESPLAAAIGAGIPIHQPSGTMVVDIGQALTEAAVISHGTMISTRTAPVGGRTAVEDVARFLREDRCVEVGESTAERVVRFSSRLRHGVTVARGMHTDTGLPTAVPLTTERCSDLLRPVVDAVSEITKNALDAAPPALAADVMESGIVITGGAAKLGGLSAAIAESTGISVRTIGCPERAVIEGARQCIDTPALAISRYRK